MKEKKIDQNLLNTCYEKLNEVYQIEKEQKQISKRFVWIVFSAITELFAHTELYSNPTKGGLLHTENDIYLDAFHEIEYVFLQILKNN